MQTFTFKAEPRDMAKKARETRKEGNIPAVMYGPGIQEHFCVKHNDIKHLIYTPDFRVGEVELGGKSHKCIVQDIQWHPMTDEIRHIDFLALKEGTKVKLEVPVKFKGVSPGVKAGGALLQLMRRVKVKLDPKDFVSELFIDISSLELGDSVRVRDIDLPENVELMVNSAVPVASVEIPRALKSAAAAAEGEEEGDAPAAAE